MHAGFTTNCTTKRKKISTKRQRAIDEHNAWLKQQGLHVDQLSSKKTKAQKLSLEYTKDSSNLKCTNGFAPAGAKKSIFDSKWKNPYRDDEDLSAREKVAIEKAELLKLRISPAYNKGAYQLITGGKEDAKYIGKK